MLDLHTRLQCLIESTDQPIDALAAVILEEIASEARWKSALANSAASLEQLAQEALEEHRASQTLPLDPDQM